MGRSSESVGDLGIAEPKVHSGVQSIPLNKILNHLYSDLLKRQGYIPTPRVGRSMAGADTSRQQAALDFYANLLNARYPAAAYGNAAYADNRFKRSPLAEASSAENVNDAFETVINDYNNNLITKRQFLPPPRIGKRLQSDLKETLALNQLTSNSIDGSSSDGSSTSLSNLGSFLQEESNLVEPIDLRTMSKIIKWYQQNKNKQLLANALSEKRANAFSSRLGRSAPLTPRLGRSYWGEANEDGSESSEHNERPYYDSPISNRIIRTALTPRIGKRSASLTKTEEKVI